MNKDQLQIKHKQIEAQTDKFLPTTLTLDFRGPEGILLGYADYDHNVQRYLEEKGVSFEFNGNSVSAKLPSGKTLYYSNSYR